MSIGNEFCLAVLHSPVHRLLSGSLTTLWYQGRRSGTDYVLALKYHEIDDKLIVWAGNAAAKTWWRNFSTPDVVMVRLRGQLRSGKAHVVHDLETKTDFLEAYLDRYPLTAPSGRASFAVRRWKPTREELRQAASSAVLVAVQLDT